MLGGRLAQRQAALRGKKAAGALSTISSLPCVPTCSSARRVPLKLFLESGSHWTLGNVRQTSSVCRVTSVGLAKENLKNVNDKLNFTGQILD
jgi:hypothetical protein